MSKSVGNVIDAHSLLTEYPVDLIRFYFMWKSSPIESLKFSLRELRSRPYQIISTLYYLHVYFKQNSTFDGFDHKKQDLKWVEANGLMSLADTWLISKLETLKAQVTAAFERCRFNDGAKAVEEFVINDLSQTYIRITRSDIWDDTSEGLNRRFAIYAVLAHALERVDIILNPITPFITEYLYLSCFPNKKSLLLECWPTYDVKFVDKRAERAIDKCRDIVSISNAARMKAFLKRRWPIKEAVVCTSDPSLLLVNDVAEILRTELNAESYRIMELNYTSPLQKIRYLIENELPIVLNTCLVKKNVARRVKAEIDKVGEALAGVDQLQIIKALETKGKLTLSYDGRQIELAPGDLAISYEVREGYAMSEREDTMVFISTQREKGLIAKGLLRDLARNLQQLRKERGYRPTEILSTAHVANLSPDEVLSLSNMKEELLHLVRVQSIIFSEFPINEINYKQIDLDDRVLNISVE
jgi:isoleucyl-tRNA synthetase